jgi:hypothetical protein
MESYMFLRAKQNNEIQTVKIVGAYPTEMWPPETNYTRYNLEITLKNGSVIKENISEQDALLKYNEVLHNRNDENYEHNLQYTNHCRSENKFA